MTCLQETFFLAGIAFLIGFKLAAHIGKRHADRLKEIYRNPPKAE